MIPLLDLGNNYRSSVLAGLFVLAALVLLGGWAAVKWGRPLQRVDYYLQLGDVTGLRTGAPVEVAGYTMGTVRSIAPKSKGDARMEFIVTLAIDDDWTIPSGTTARFHSPGLLASPVIDLRLGDGAPLPPRNTLEFLPEVDLADRLESVLTTADQRLNEMATQTQAVLAAAERLLDEELPATLAQALDDVETISKPLAETAARIDGLIGELAGQDMAKIRQVLADAQQASAQLSLLLQETRGLVARARGATQSLAGTLTKTAPALTAASGDLEYTLRLSADRLPGILNDLERTSQDLSGLAADLRSNPVSALRGRGTETPTWIGESSRR